MSEWVLSSAHLQQARHGFFTRLGGVSVGGYASLNCSTRSGDDPAALRENRARVAARIGVSPAHLLGVTQVHGDVVVSVTEPWEVGSGPRADALVSARADIALGVITADCAPVLFADETGSVVGAAHAGWRGAVGGVLEATVRAMGGLGVHSPSDITAVVGPCIGPEHYEVGRDMRDEVLACDPAGIAHFRPGDRPDHYYFDLPAYCLSRLRRAGVERVAALGFDTLGDERRFFSHRRRTLAGGGVIGHQISVIAAGR